MSLQTFLCKKTTTKKYFFFLKGPQSYKKHFIMELNTIFLIKNSVSLYNKITLVIVSWCNNLH